MNPVADGWTSPLGLAMNAVRGWVRLYTSGLPAAAKDGRRAEIDADLWEHAAWGTAGSRSTSAHILARMVLGIPADISWHISELGGPEMERSAAARVLFAGTALLGALSVLMAVGLMAGLSHGAWSIHDRGGLGGFVLLGAIAGLTGPFAALAGAYKLRRAKAENRPQVTGRVLLVAGTCGIGILAGAMYWTMMIGQVIAAAIACFWLLRLGGWRLQRPPIP